VWVLDPAARSITVYESLLAPRLLTADEELDGAPVLPGFRRRVAEFFAY
jgi:Uma2 family endonuclease